MLGKIDSLLNSITMYRLLAYGLSCLAVISLVFSLFGTLSLSPLSLLASLGILLTSCYVTNWVLAGVWRVPTNNESWFITALILFFILPQASTVSKVALIALAGLIAIASKFMIVWHRKHIFNPAALAVAILGAAGLIHTSWWIGSSVLWPFILLYGLLVLYKIRRSYLFLSFALTSLAVAIITSHTQGQGIYQAISLAITSSPLIFLGTIMLTEPATMPAHKNHQIIFAILVATLYSLHWNIAGIFIAPEIALLAGNIYAYVVSPRYRLQLQLKRVEQISGRVFNYIFTPDRKMTFLPGQYMEWTLPFVKQDSRGNRRTFTIASSPTENEIHLGVKFYEPSSSYKKALRSLQPGDSIYAGQLAGNFILPKDSTQKLVFIAGGIGITPFRSMLKYIIDTNEQRNVVLLYLVSDPREVAYRNVLVQATKHGVQTVNLLTRNNPLDSKMIERHVPDYLERNFFVSGSHVMVDNTRGLLLELGVKRVHIKADYFSGY